MKFYITPTMDPNTIRRGNWEREPAQKLYLNRLVSDKRIGRPAIRYQTHLPPEGTLLNPTLRQLDHWLEEFKHEKWSAISHDLETAGQFIICNGMVPFDIDNPTRGTGRPICLRFRGRLGHRWWPDFESHQRAVQFQGNILAMSDVAFVGHNILGFDIPLLLDHGFQINGPIIDTMVLMSRAYPELPKGLQFSATLFCGAPAWKRMVKDKDDGDQKT